MKNPKEVLQVSKNKRLVAFLVPLFLFSSCAHNFDHKAIEAYNGTIEQVLKVKINNKDDKQRLTVYASINRENKRAILDGVGKLDKHVFTLEIKNGQYLFKDHINDKQETGALRDFEMIPLDEETIFTKIDKDNTQPIIIENPAEKIYVEITVTEQRGIK